MIIPEIDDKISEQYGIMPRGLVGMEIVRGISCAGVFNNYRPEHGLSEQDCRRLNWRDAVSYAALTWPAISQFPTTDPQA